MPSFRSLVTAGAWVAAFLAAAGLRAAGPEAAPSPADLQFFEAKVRPVLAAKCYSCHSKQADKVRGGLLLDTREALLQGGNTGPGLVPGKPAESLLVEAIRYENPDLQMPPKGEKLSDREIADLTEWVRRGAPDPRSAAAKGVAAGYGGVGRAHWAFQPVEKPSIPAVQDKGWVRNPIDAFILAKLEANGILPSPAADRATLIRRIYYDLVGLPPTAREVLAFVKDPDPEAYTKLVDRLLTTPQYGEHWGRYWLDVARYADTKGDPARQEDNRMPHAWTYRDWVISALNMDMPYNQFIIAQLAGDRLQVLVERKSKEAGQPVPDRGSLAALGFLTLGNHFDGRRDDVIADQIDVTTKAFLGLTVACARCHDHKFDPIPTKDYYSLYGVFANSTPPKELPTLMASVPRTTELLEYYAKSAELAKQEQEIAEQRRELGRRGKGADPMKRRELVRQEKELHRKVGDLESTHAGAPARANVLSDVPKSKDYPVLLRGEAANKGEVVPRRFLEILSADPKKRPTWKNGSGRAELAMAIADPKNPLTARVLVNRLWQQHWGEGFVATPDDLGNMSAAPTHPELLDWLAATFVEGGWSMKAVHRLIVLSSAYQQGSTQNPASMAADPDNKLYWRYNLRRLDFEQLHDGLLAVTGELDLTRGGRPVTIASAEFAKRRAVYTLIDRTNAAELLTQFDFPSPDVVSGRRYETLVPQQALFLMNSPMVIETARKLVEYPGFATFNTDEERVAALYLAIYQRMPTAKEVALGVAYVKANPGGTALEGKAAPPKATAKPTAREQKQAERVAASAKRPVAKGVVQVGGVHESSAPLSAWTKLAHALFQSNEAMFYN